MEHYFDDHSLLREVVGHRLTGLSGPRALLVMAAHPVAFAGFFAHTGALDDPYARLQRTATVMDAVAFDTKARADKLTAHVRAMHRTVSGRAGRGRGPVPGRHALPRRRPEAPAVDPGRAGGVGDARLRQVRPLALARRARRAVGRLPRGRPPLRPARARDAARHRRLPRLHGRDVRERRVARDAGSAGARDRHRHASAACRCRPSRWSNWSTRSRSAGCQATSAASTGSAGTRCARRAARRRGVRQAVRARLAGRAGLELRLPGRSPGRSAALPR